jgi:hypothetical protein
VNSGIEMRPQGLIFSATTNGGRGRLALAVLVLLAFPLPARSDKPAAMADRVVDQVAIKAGPRLVGAVLGREADGTIAFAIPRAWLKKTHPQFFDEIARDEGTETHAALTELVGRIADWRKARGGEKDLAFFLEREADRVEKELKAIDEGTRVEEAPFMVLDVAPSKIERVVNQPLQRLPSRPGTKAWPTSNPARWPVSCRSSRGRKSSPSTIPRPCSSSCRRVGRTKRHGLRARRLSNIVSSSRSIFREPATSWFGRETD